MARCQTTVSLLSAVILLSALSVSAQTTGSIRGRTVDADGQALPGVTIEVTGEVLGSAQRTAVTGASGGFSFAAMPIGTFKVTATLEGYQTQAAEEVRVAIGKVLSLEFNMPEAYSDEVTVTATPIIDVASPTFDTRLDFDKVVDLPTRGNFYDLMATTPGITQSSEGSEFINAFGADAKASQWNIDGVNRTTPGAGYLAWTFNEEMVAEYAVLGTGASAEYGQMLGTVFNVVTKTGTNRFHGSARFTYQNPSWVDENAVSQEEDTPDEARTYRLDTNDKLSATLGGPIVRDKLWFFVGGEWGRFNAYWPDQVPGPDPKDDTSALYDGKITGQLGHSHRFNLTFNDHDRLEPAGGSVWAEPTTWTEFTVDTQSFALDYSGLLGQNTILEARYGELESHEEVRAQTPTDEQHFIDYTVSPEETFGGPYWPWLWDSHMETGEIKLTQHADDFLKGDHEFRFGIQYNRMGELGEPTDITYSYKYDYYNVLYGTDYYWYEYNYRFVATPHFYGGESETWSAFFADSWRINSDVTLELGVRYDSSKGWIEDLARLDDNNNPTGEIIPGRDQVEWDYFDPRLGFAWNIGGTGTNVLRGSVGRFHAGLIAGDYNYPPPEMPPYWYEWQNPETEEWEYSHGLFQAEDVSLRPGVENAQTWEYTLGFEHQLTATSTIGISAAYKQTTNLMGWYIVDDGEFNWETIINDVTGEEIQLKDYLPLAEPTRLKGNSTGPGALGGDRPYEQEYKGVFLTYTKRLSNNWDLFASYSWSESTGLNPTFNSGGGLDEQGAVFWDSTTMSNPNIFYGATSDRVLGGDRTHILRLAGNVMLPYQFRLNSVVNLQSGRIYDRRQNYVLPNTTGYIVTEPAADRLPTQYLWDFGVGKHFYFGKDLDFSIYLQILNILNDDAITGWQDLAPRGGGGLIPDAWVLPRRANIRLRFAF
jgi:hypothetical protein